MLEEELVVALLVAELEELDILVTELSLETMLDDGVSDETLLGEEKVALDCPWQAHISVTAMRQVRLLRFFISYYCYLRSLGELM